MITSAPLIFCLFTCEPIGEKDGSNLKQLPTFLQVFWSRWGSFEGSLPSFLQVFWSRWGSFEGSIGEKVDSNLNKGFCFAGVGIYKGVRAGVG